VNSKVNTLTNIVIIKIIFFIILNYPIFNIKTILLSSLRAIATIADEGRCSRVEEKVAAY
jgi:hypothetical protein